MVRGGSDCSRQRGVVADVDSDLDYSLDRAWNGQEAPSSVDSGDGTSVSLAASFLFGLGAGAFAWGLYKRFGKPR